MITVRFGGLLHSCHTTFWAQDGQHALPGAPNVQEGPDGLDVNRSWVDAGLLARPSRSSLFLSSFFLLLSLLSFFLSFSLTSLYLFLFLECAVQIWGF